MTAVYLRRQKRISDKQRAKLWRRSLEGDVSSLASLYIDVRDEVADKLGRHPELATAASEECVEAVQAALCELLSDPRTDQPILDLIYGRARAIMQASRAGKIRSPAQRTARVLLREAIGLSARMLEAMNTEECGQ